jgi:hypothetical protein
VDNPSELLLAFIKEMNEIEVESRVYFQGTKSNPLAYINIFNEKAKVIFEKYCSKKNEIKIPKSISSNPDYEPNETIIDVKTRGEKVFITTENPVLYQKKSKYRIIKEDGKWKIDQRWVFAWGKFQDWYL